MHPSQSDPILSTSHNAGMDYWLSFVIIGLAASHC